MESISNLFSAVVPHCVSAIAQFFATTPTTSAFNEAWQLTYLPCFVLSVLLMLLAWIFTGISVAVGLDKSHGYTGGMWSLGSGVAVAVLARMGLRNDLGWWVFGTSCAIVVMSMCCAVMCIVRRLDLTITRRMVAAIVVVLWNVFMVSLGGFLFEIGMRCPATLIVVIPLFTWISTMCCGDMPCFLPSSKAWVSVRMVCSLIWIGYVSSSVLDMKAGDTSTHSMFDFLLKTGLVGLLQSAFLVGVWGASVNKAANTEHYVAWYDGFGNLIRRERAPGEDVMGCLMSIFIGFFGIALLSAFLGPLVFVVNTICFADVWARGSRVHILCVLATLAISGAILYNIPKTWSYVSDRTSQIKKQLDAETTARQPMGACPIPQNRF